MADEAYDIMPHREIMDLKRQIQELKAKSGTGPSAQITNSIDALAKSMDSMLKLFTQAADELKTDEKEGPAILQELEPLKKKIDEVIDQNRIIAEGIVALSDMVEDVKKELAQHKEEPSHPIPPHESVQPQPFNPGMNIEAQPPPSMLGPMPPSPGTLRSQGPVAMPSMPFPDMEEPKKKGLFGRLRK